ncbi:MAG: ribosome-associated translation inhibitor RaiA [Bacteriovoracaceae bacterium]|nr:ribosome-associated translation inhibitor RaiA [Bacteriovoracaceae bacterium]
MKTNITFRNLEHTPSLDDKIKEKSQKLQKHLREDAEVSWTCWTEKEHQIAEIKVKSGKDNFIAKAESESLYKTMDMVISKIENQISHKH